MKAALLLCLVPPLADVCFLSLLQQGLGGSRLLQPLSIWMEALFRFCTLFLLWLAVSPKVAQSSEVAPSPATGIFCLSTLCFVTPVFEGVKRLLYPDTPASVPLGSCSWTCVSFTYVASALAFLLWNCLLASSGDGSEDETRDKKARATMRRLLTYSKPDVPYLSGAFVFLTFAVIGETFIPYYTGKVIDILGTTYNSSVFTTAIFFMCISSMGSSLAAGCRGGLFMFTFSRLNNRIRNLLFKSVVNQDIGFFESVRTGDITTRLSTDTTLMSRSIAANVNIFLRSLVKTLGIYSFMFSLSWQLTVLTFIESPVTIFAQKLYNTYYQDLVKEVQTSMAKSGEVAAETISSIKTVRSFATEDDESKRYDSKLMDTHNLKTKRDFVRAVYLLFRRMLQLSMQVLILYCGKLLIESGRMSSGNLVSFILYQMDVGSYIQTLVHIYGAMIHSVGAAEKVFEYLDRKPAVSTEGSLVKETLRGHVEFRNVSFSYPSRSDIQVLKNVSFDLKPGEITALVGPSGGGKSTCVCLLERFYKPQSGEILLDGVPIQQYDHKYLHKQVALVGQEPVLFAGSVRDNISYGIQNSSMADVTAAAHSANAHGFIESLENSYETDAGEKGGQLSGGQKQRIAIARALIREPQVLIMDEATSSLDIDSEYKIQESLSRIEDQTILVIAHRLKTVEKADKIIVIENGEVVEQGNHLQLLEQKGCYYKLVQRLFNEK
nr:PREDICTED: antigen peptide transporter 2 [Latimeria chalumnae]|eukprot:XP_006001020.1 PREDICTED: antigen peptide transporter 2 [Latimeria chalumnae]